MRSEVSQLHMGELGSHPVWLLPNKLPCFHKHLRPQKGCGGLL